MREIKFRSWHSTEHFMVSHEGLALSFSYRVLSSPHYIFMQYTGLKDKNGKEIYEGDILSTSNNDPEYDLWDAKDFGAVAVYWDGIGWNSKPWSFDLDDDNESIYAIKFISIIGNIYENPELLKEAK
jgi:uncharacterized phage protein (TIGR01671 family)